MTDSKPFDLDEWECRYCGSSLVPLGCRRRRRVGGLSLGEAAGVVAVGVVMGGWVGLAVYGALHLAGVVR